MMNLCKSSVTLVLFLAVIQAFYVQPTANKTFGGIYSSDYGKFTIGVKNDTLSGKYLLLSQWDNKVHAFLHQDFFNIYGTSTDGIHFKVFVIAIGLSNNIIQGNVNFLENGKKLKIVLKDDVPTGTTFDITKDSEDNIFPLTQSKPIIGVGEVKTKKTKLFGFDGKNFRLKKAYLVSGNDVSIISTNSKYSKIEYTNEETGKVTQYWIQTADIDFGDPRQL